MTPGRRALIRISASARHRPYWLAMFAAVELIAWGGYVLAQNRMVLRHTAFAVLTVVPDGSVRAGSAIAS